MTSRKRGVVVSMIAMTLFECLVVVIGYALPLVAQQSEAKIISSAASRTFTKIDQNQNGILEPDEWNALHAMRDWLLARGNVRLPEPALLEFARLHQDFIRGLRQREQRSSNTHKTHFSHEGGKFIGSFQAINPTKTPRDELFYEHVVVLGNSFSGLRDNRLGPNFGAGRVNPLGFKFVLAADSDRHAKNWSQAEVARFAKLDKNHDGFLTAEELDDSRHLKQAAAYQYQSPSPQSKKATLPSNQRTRKFPAGYQHRDRNNDGQIALYEWLGATPVPDAKLMQQSPRIAVSRYEVFRTSRQNAIKKAARGNRPRSRLLKNVVRPKPNASRKHLFRRYQKPTTSKPR